MISQHKPLEGLSVALLVSDLFEQSELADPKRALEAAGAHTAIVSDHGPRVYGMHHDEKADAFEVDLDIDAVRADDFDALVLPGGTFNADALRMVKSAQRLAREFDEAGKPIGVICHGPWLLVSAGLVPGRTLTSWPTLADDIRNAGGTWADSEVLVDGNWISSRKPDDLPAFNRELIAALERVPQVAAPVTPMTE